jgi:hypothetical protein
MQLYTIAELEWVREDDSECLVAQTCFGEIAAYRFGAAYIFEAPLFRQREKHPTLAAAKAAAEAWYRERLTSALRPAGEVREWQPIESAPKDGKWVLLWWPYWSSLPVIGLWLHGHWYSDSAVSDSEGNQNPTHWHPLPAPPADAKGGG